MTQKNNSANIALCYVRLSYTRDADDANSPERQRANIVSICERNGWQMEWYEDVGGHKSGRYEKNRPQWLALKKRLGDSDIVALVANDLARLHRKGWRIGDLVDHLDKYDVALVLAAPGREVDTATPQGRMFVQFSAMFDEYYASDLSARAKDSVSYRKSQGKTVGMPPFGTVRNREGYLTQSNEGAWLLPNGKFVAGIKGEIEPELGAIWRSYYDAAEKILQIYADGSMGLEKIAYLMSDEGWAFRTRKGKPRPITRADVRRVIANWPEYGGLALDNKAKDRPGYEQQEYELDPYRAVFPVELLLQVAQIRQERSLKPKNHGVNRQVRIYPLSGITYCAHCEQLAEIHHNPELRTRLNGYPGKVLRYRHKPGVTCGCSNKSVPCSDYEDDFRRLLDLLTVDEKSLGLMREMAIQVDSLTNRKDRKNLEAQKAEEIAKCNRRIEAARSVYLDGDMTREEYIQIKTTNERTIQHWEARTTETEKLATELAMCLSAVEKVRFLWDNSDAADKRGLAQNLFDYVVYDLDSRRIVDFRLQAWADRFLVLRAALYAEENKSTQAVQDLCTEMPHRGLEPLF